MSVKCSSAAGVINWGQSIATLADRFGSLPAVCTDAGEHSFTQWAGRAARLAAALQVLNVRPGEPVATLLPNSAAAVWAATGVMLAGAAEMSLAADLAADELRYRLDLLSVRHVIADARTQAAVKAAGRKALRVEELASEEAEIDRASAVAGDAWGKLLFTSGTTGNPKAIVHSHGRRWIANMMLRASLPFQPTTQSRILLMTPYSHGASLLAAAFLDTGASIHLMDGVQVDRVRSLLVAGDVDCMFAPPTVLAKLVNELAGFSCGSLRVIFTGTATLTGALYDKVRAMFGPIVRVTYGKTEIFNPITVLPPADCDAAFACAGEDEGAKLGWPASGVEIEIRDETGARCATGQPGRIFLRAPHQLVGYVDAVGFHAVAPHDWHESGDIGLRTPRGELILRGRDHDMIKTGGYKIFPGEVEAPLEKAALASEIIAVGVPSQYWGQIVVLVAEGASAGWQSRARQAAEGLSRHKRPRAYVELPALPRNAQGKLQRSKVVQMLMERYRIQDGPHPRLEPL